MSLFTILFLAMIVGIPIYIYIKLSEYHDYEFESVAILALGSIIFIFFSFFMLTNSNLIENFPMSLFLPFNMTIGEGNYTITTSNSANTTNTDIMSILNKTPEDTNKYWNNDWTKRGG